MTVDEQQALDNVYEALDEAELPDVQVILHPQHVAAIGPTGDFAIWVSPWGRPTIYKVEGASDTHRCGATKHVVELLRKLTKP